MSLLFFVFGVKVDIMSSCRKCVFVVEIYVTARLEWLVMVTW